MTKTHTVWELLSKIDVSDHVEKKNGMTYLSWAWAWRTLKDNFPDATFKKHVNDNGYPCFLDHNGNAFVCVTVTVGNESQTEVFPVLDFKNRGVQNPDGFQVNTALQRCLTKAIGYLGLGFYIYAGEDLPTSDDTQNKPEQVKSSHRDPLLAKSPAPTPPPSGAGATDSSLQEKLASVSELNGLNSLYNEMKAEIEAMSNEQRSETIAQFSARKAELKG